MTLRLTRSLTALAALLMLAGCGTLVTHHTDWEYRYRVFEALDPLPLTMNAPLSRSMLAERFVPVGALNRSFDQLTSEGFEFVKVERVPGTQYHTFIFRRLLPPGYRPTRAPMEYTGVFMVEGSDANPTYLSLAPRFKGYTVFTFTGGKMVDQFDADWNGEELTARVGPVDHTLLISNDGMSLAHTSESIEHKVLNRKVINAMRVQSGK